MKILVWSEATAVFVAVATTMSAQSEVPNDSSRSSSYIEVSKLGGRKVASSEGKDIGVIKDFVIDRTDGCMAYTVVSTGGNGTGVSSGSGKIVAIPWAVYSLTSDPSVLTVNVDRAKIFNAPAFEYARMDEYARPDYINNVYSYYGVAPGPRTTAAASSGTKPGTDVTGTAGATASPGEVASPAPIATVAPNPGASARTRASSAANSYGTSAASRKTIQNARTFGGRRSIDRGETASPTTTEESRSESTTTLNENKKSLHKVIEDTSTRRPSTTPQSTDERD
jgi:sporulation protein YlmC with PRC-barrel domain